MSHGDDGIRGYLEALESAGERGFAPYGWLYKSVMDGLLEQGFAEYAPPRAYKLSEKGKAELARLRAVQGKTEHGENRMNDDRQIAQYLALIDNSSRAMRPTSWMYKTLLAGLVCEGLALSTEGGFILSAAGKQMLDREREAQRMRDGEDSVGREAVSPGRSALDALEGCSVYVPTDPFTVGRMLEIARRGWAIQEDDRFSLSPAGASELARQRAEEEKRLGMYEMQERAGSAATRLRDIADRLSSVELNPRFDEEYKVKQWYRHFTSENFDQLDALVNALSAGFEEKIGKEL